MMKGETLMAGGERELEREVKEDTMEVDLGRTLSGVVGHLITVAEVEHGLKNGWTAAYWSVLSTLEKHLIKGIKK